MKARVREIMSTCLIFLAVILLGCGLRVAWIVGAVGGAIRMSVMIQDRRWYYVALDVGFLIIDVMMFMAWSGYWPNYIKLWIMEYVSWLAF